MGKLECKYCGAIAEADSFDEADSLIDHSIGLYKSNGCPGDDKDLLWDGEPAFEVSYKLVATAAHKQTITEPKSISKSKSRK